MVDFTNNLQRIWDAGGVGACAIVLGFGVGTAVIVFLLRR
jgi:hypothetical protein